MTPRRPAAAAVFAAAFAIVPAAAAPLADDGQPFKLMQQPQQQPSVYALPTPPTEDQGVNMGGVNLDMEVRYLSEHIYRGVNVTEWIGDVTDEESSDRANFQFDGKLEFNLGKMPHPFIGVFANVIDSDPVSNFQEVRPVFGFEWKIRPLIISAGNTLYVYPDRTELGTGEVWGKIVLDDSVLLRNEEPLLSPYVYGAYDYDNYEGWYLEAGVSHTFKFEDTGITLTLVGAVAYVYNHEFFIGPTGEDRGFQHWEVGAIGKYNLNELLNIPQRYGTWTINGYVFYADGIDKDLRGDTELWGGAGIQLRY